MIHRHVARTTLAGVGAVVLALAVLLGGCGGGDDDAAPGDEAGTATTVDRPANPESELAHPCDLVSVEQVSELFGEAAVELDRVTEPIVQCTWTVQAAIDAPTLENAGKQVSLGYAAPPAGLEGSADDYFAVLRSPASGLELGDVDGFGRDAFTIDGQLYVLDGDLILVAMAGLSEDAVALATRDGLMRAALEAL